MLKHKSFQEFIFYFTECPVDVGISEDDDDAGAKELQELRDRYEGKVTASLYTGTLFVTAIASLIALVVLCILHINVSVKLIKLYETVYHLYEQK